MGKSEKFKYRVWKEGNFVAAEIRFEDWDDPDLKKFQNLYAEKIKNSRNLEIVKHGGYPTKLDSEYILLEKGVAEKIESMKTKFRNEYWEAPIHPGFCAFLFRTKKYIGHSQLVEKRNAEIKKFLDEVDKVSSFCINTTHDYPYIECYSKIHTKEELELEIKEIINSIKKQITTQSSGLYYAPSWLRRAADFCVMRKNIKANKVVKVSGIIKERVCQLVYL